MLSASLLLIARESPLDPRSLLRWLWPGWLPPPPLLALLWVQEVALSVAPSMIDDKVPFPIQAPWWWWVPSLVVPNKTHSLCDAVEVVACRHTIIVKFVESSPTVRRYSQIFLVTAHEVCGVVPLRNM